MRKNYEKIYKKMKNREKLKKSSPPCFYREVVLIFVLPTSRKLRNSAHGWPYSSGKMDKENMVFAENRH